jgi:hypothetical protein
MPTNTQWKKRGRPSNPYKAQALFGDAGWTKNFFDMSEDDLAPLGTPPDIPVALVIQGLLLQAGLRGAALALPRTTIEETLNVDYRIARSDITNALKKLRERDEESPLLQVYRTKVEVMGQHTPSDIYSIGHPASPAELKALRKMLEQRTRDFDPRLKGKCAEHYVWSLLRQSKRFSLHRKSKCGELRDAEGKNKLDLLAIEKTSGTRLGISVKNERQWFHPRHPAIEEILQMAEAHAARPMLVVAHITREAIERCARGGITVLELGRQLIPAELPDGRRMLTIVNQLRPILGPQRFDFITKQFPRIGQRSDGILRDMEFVKNLTL